MEKKILCFLVFLCGGFANAQEVEGRLLKGFTSEPVPNASIEVEGSALRTIADAEGYFSLQVEEFPVTLRISALGFAARELRVSQANPIHEIRLFPEAEDLSEVVLESTLIPARLRQTPAAVSVITGEELQRYDETNVLQAVNTVPGVYVHQGALNTNKLNIRGIGARSQYSTNRVKAYFEGIPLSTAEGETTLDDIDQEVVDRVEIIKGPTSSIYGAGLGGVINLSAAEADPGETRAGVKTTIGSFGLRKKTAKTSHGAENTSLFAAYNHLESDSFRENGSYDRKAMTFHAGLDGFSSGKLKVLGNFTRLMAYIPSSIDEEQLRTAPETAAYTWGASQGYESYDKGLLGISYQHEFSEVFSNTTSVYVNFRNAYEPRPFDILKEEQVAMGVRTKFNYAHQLFGSSSEWSFGTEYYHEWYDTATFENLYEEFPDEGSVAGNNLSNNNQTRRYLNLFGQWNYALLERLDLQAGLNVNTTSYELTDLFHRDAIDQTGDYRFETVVSPRLGAVYSLADKRTLYASVSHGFSTPGVAETLTPEGLINTSLQPETGINYEIGHKGHWLQDRLYAEIALFSVQVNDLIVAERVAEDQYIGRNLGKTDHNGAEIFLSYRADISPSVEIQPYIKASLNNFTFDDYIEEGTDYAGNEIPGVPERMINAGLDFRALDGFSIHARFQHIGEIPLDDANSLYNESYNLFHLKSAYTFRLFQRLDVELLAGINNLFDEFYASSVLPNAVGFGDSQPRYYYPGEPRNYYVGLGVDYLF